MKADGDGDPKYLLEGKSSYQGGWYPTEDIEKTDMFRPFFRRRRTWLVVAGLAIMMAAAYGLRPEVPEAGGMNPQQVGVGLGIFCCIAFLWLTEALPLAATALLVPVLAVGLRVMDMKSALAGFAHPLIFLFFGGFALASAMAYQGLDRWIANRIIRAGKGSFMRVACLLFGATAGLSMWMSNTATTAMMMPLALGLIRQMEKEEKTAGDTGRNRVFLLLGVAYAASIGGIGTLVGSPPNAIAAQQLGIGFGEWMRVGIPAVLVLLPLMVLVLWSVCRPVKGLQVRVRREPFVFNWHRAVTLGIFAATALCWVCGAKLGGWLGIGGSVDTLVALAAVLALLYFGVVRWRAIDHGTDWGVLLLFGGGITLSSILGQTGASVFLATEFSGLVRAWPPMLVIGAVVCFVIFLTELASNTATAALMVPIFFSVSGALGIAPEKMVVPLAIATSCAFMLPVATPPNAIVFGTGQVTQRQMMRVGLVLNLVFVIGLTLLAQWLF